MSEIIPSISYDLYMKMSYCYNNVNYAQIRDETERLKRDMSKNLKTDITNGQKPEFVCRIYIHLPKEGEHKDHIIGEVC